MDVLQRVLKRATVQPWRPYKLRQTPKARPGHLPEIEKYNLACQKCQDSNFFEAKKRSQLAPFSHYVVLNQPTNWAVNMVTRLRCILSSLSNSR